MRRDFVKKLRILVVALVMILVLTGCGQITTMDGFISNYKHDMEYDDWYKVNMGLRVFPYLNSVSIDSATHCKKCRLIYIYEYSL